jgi:hypothetical protein
MLLEFPGAGKESLGNRGFGASIIGKNESNERHDLAFVRKKGAF